MKKLNNYNNKSENLFFIMKIKFKLKIPII